MNYHDELRVCYELRENIRKFSVRTETLRVENPLPISEPIAKRSHLKVASQINFTDLCFGRSEFLAFKQAESGV